MVHCVEC